MTSEVRAICKEQELEAIIQNILNEYDALKKKIRKMKEPRIVIEVYGNCDGSTYNSIQVTRWIRI